MTQILPNIFAIEVPEDFVGADIVIINDTALLRMTSMNLSATRHSETTLGTGSYEILFPTLNCSEEQAAGAVAVKEANGYPIGFKDYEDETCSFRDARYSLQSLLRSNGLDSEKNYLLIKRKA